METLVQDLTFAIRSLIKNPAVTIVCVLALAIGIGANSAIFSVIDAVLIRPLPYYQGDRLVTLWEKRAQLARGSISFADFSDWKNQNQSFADIAAYQTDDFNLTGSDEPEQVQGVSVSANLLALLGVRPALGSLFPSEENQVASATVILSHELWLNRFGADPAVVGKILNLDNKTYVVIGVMPEKFYFPGKQFQLWVPLSINPNSPQAGRGMHYLQAIGRLKRGVTLAQARSEMDTIASRLEQQFPKENTGHGANVFSLQEEASGDSRARLVMILFVTCLVLIIACANVANLLLARATARQKELAVRSSLGASTVRIVRQLLTESILLSLLGGVIGLMLAGIGIRLIIALSPGGVPRIEESTLNFSVVAFTFFIAVATGIVVGVAPALQVDRLDINELLKASSSRGSTGSTSKKLRRIFVITEVALSLMVLVGAGLMIKSFVRLMSVSPGFSADNILTGSVTLPNSKYRGGQRAAFLQRVLERLQNDPQVIAAGAVSHLPLAGNGPTFNFDIQGRPAPKPGEEFKAQLRVASPDYFRAIGIPLLAGRSFTNQDAKDSPNVVIINDVAAQRYWPDESALEKQISIDQDDKGNPIWRQVIGVVRGIRHTSLEFQPEPQMYTPYTQFSMPYINVVLHTNTPALDLAADLKSAVAAADKDQPIAKIRTIEQVLAESTAPRRFNLLLLSVFAATALFLVATGIYGVISYFVSQRTNEIGVRSALGARRVDILKLVIGEGMGLALIGVAVGLAASFALTRTISNLLFSVSTTDPVIFAQVTGLILVVALLACYVPARRAANVNAVIALRAE